MKPLHRVRSGRADRCRLVSNGTVAKLPSEGSTPKLLAIVRIKHMWYAEHCKDLITGLADCFRDLGANLTMTE